MTAHQSSGDTSLEPEGEAQLRDLISFTAGAKTLAVFAEDVEITAEGNRRAKLPRAPTVVLGVVCVRGRMLTVLDPSALIDGEPVEWPMELPYVIAIRGDEQLALAADSLRDTITIAATDIERVSPNGANSAGSAVLGIARHGGEEITILEARRLFSAAFQRRERRRRRF